jgi:hypothetical protein
MMHPDITLENGRVRARDMLAAADRRRLARQVRGAARRPAARDSRVHGLRRVLPRWVW